MNFEKYREKIEQTSYLPVISDVEPRNLIREVNEAVFQLMDQYPDIDLMSIEDTVIYDEKNNPKEAILYKSRRTGLEVLVLKSRNLIFYRKEKTEKFPIERGGEEKEKQVERGYMEILLDS